jgi:NAD+ synthase (glutamine-hydrolysing)
MPIIPLRVALAQLNVTVGDIDGNKTKILQAMRQAHAAGAHIVCFPELALTGYSPEDLLLKPSFVTANLTALNELIASSDEFTGLTSIIGFVDRKHDIYNAAAIVHDGQLVGTYYKHYLPTYSIFDEYRYFKAGQQAPLFLINGVHVGVNICEDVWYPTGPMATQAHAGAEVIININGSPFHTGKDQFRKDMITTRAADNGVIVAYLNIVGGQDEVVFDGGSMVIDANGKLIARAKRFEEDLLIVDMDTASVFRSRLHDPRRRQGRLQVTPEDVPLYVISKQSAPTSAMLQNEESIVIGAPQRIEPAMSPLEEIYSTLVLGTKDYVRKNGSQKALVGLSGNIGSSLVAAVAVDALGPANVLGISMPSDASAESSNIDARKLAENLGIQFLTIPIEEVFHTSFQSLVRTIGKDDSGLPDENLLARLRGTILMTIANKLGSVVLTTGNKSEMAVGSCTLSGDMIGGFAVIKDVFKSIVHDLCCYRNTLGSAPVIPDSIINKLPLADGEPNQNDVSSMLPYKLLDPILSAYVEQDNSIDELIAMGFDQTLVQRVTRLVDLSEAERRQTPIGIKISSRSFGHDRRVPITNRYQDTASSYNTPWSEIISASGSLLPL